MKITQNPIKVITSVITITLLITIKAMILGYILTGSFDVGTWQESDRGLVASLWFISNTTCISYFLAQFQKE